MWPVSTRFVEEIQKPVHTLAARLEILDTNFNAIHVINQVGEDKQGTLIDGTVDADTSRGARRAVTLSMLNEDGRYSPRSDTFSMDSASYRAAVMTTSPIRYFRFGEASGTTAVDQTGNENWTYSGGTSLNADGLLIGDTDSAVKFDGTGSMASGTNLGLASHSVAVWFRRDGLAGDATGAPISTYHQIAQYLMGTQGNLYVHTDGYILYQATLAAGGTANYFAGGTSAYRPFAEVGSMHFLVATYDGTTMRIYVDGVEQGTGLAAALATNVTTLTSRFGRPDNYRPNGVMDEGAIWNRALTADEIATLYKVGNPPPSNDVDAAGFLYVNRMFRMWRGIRFEDNTEELVPVGTFMVDKAETLVERGISSVVITGTDLWKKFHKSQFTTPKSFASGTLLNTIIKSLASEAGVTMMNLDPLTERTLTQRRINTTLEFEPGDIRGDALIKLAENYGLHIYFDPMGVLVSEDFRNPFQEASAWSFGQDDSLAYYIRTVTEDSALYNHVIVTGTGATKTDPPGPVYVAQRMDTDAGSPTNINRIGSRVYRFESGILSTQGEVDKAADKIFYDHFVVSRSVNLETICLPFLEGNDVITVTEPRFARLDNRRYLISSFNIPLTTSKQKLGVKEVVNIAPSA